MVTRSTREVKNADTAPLLSSALIRFTEMFSSCLCTAIISIFKRHDSVHQYTV